MLIYFVKFIWGSIGEVNFHKFFRQVRILKLSSFVGNMQQICIHGKVVVFLFEINFANFRSFSLEFNSHSPRAIIFIFGFKLCALAQIGRFPLPVVHENKALLFCNSTRCFAIKGLALQFNKYSPS